MPFLRNEEVVLVTKECGVRKEEPKRTLPGFAVRKAMFILSLGPLCRIKTIGLTRKAVAPESRLEQESWDGFQKQPAGSPDEAMIHFPCNEDLPTEQ